MDTSLGDSDQIDNDVIEIIPLNEYESKKAKLKASLSWILHKAFSSSVPSEFQQPFYETPEGALHIKPRLANLMVTSELYCQACTNMFGDSHSQWQGHWSIIQVLSRKGIYVTEVDDNAVTETVLMKTAPFKLNAHLALIDALMMAYSSEVTSIENVVHAVRQFATFNASSELPSTTEDTLMFWINKVCMTVQQRELKSSQLIQGESHQKVRIVSRNTPRDQLTVPVLDDIIKDIGDGASLAVLVHFYCPHLVKLDDICLKANIGIADSLHNLRLVRSFCEKHIPAKCFHLTYEDYLYTHNDLKQNIYIMISELFYWFELKKADCVKEAQRKELAEQPATTSRMASHTSIPQVPISNATKRSFHKQIMDDQRISQTYVPPRQPLLHKRQQQSVESLEADPSVYGTGKSKKNVRRSQSLTSPQDRDLIKQSVLAWQDSNKHHMRSHENLNQEDQVQDTTSSNLLANVSIDSQLDDSFSDDRLEGLDFMTASDSTPSPTPTRNVSIDSPHPKTIQPGHPDYLELESVTSGVNTSRTYVCDEHQQTTEINPEDFLPKKEPLLPARLKTAKEKINNHSKEEERGDTLDKRKVRSPPKSKNSLISSHVTEASDESGSLSDIVTPLPDDQLSARDLYVSSPRQNSKGYAAFVMVGDPKQDLPSPRSHSGSEKSVSSDREIKSSYTVTDHTHTSETARAAGIPIVDSTDTLVYQRRGSREGSVTSSRSSGDFSDHESQKIHRDHKTRESENIKTLLSQNRDLFSVQKPMAKVIQKQESGWEKSRPLTTNFAEIKRMKQNIGKVDNSGYIYMQHGQEASNTEPRKSSVKDKFERNKVEKKTSFAALPNQTTWQQTSSRVQSGSERMENGEETPSAESELSQIRLKLEEKRKLIERKKQTMEIQQQKMRQRLGKTAFLHVVSKTKEENASSSESGSEMSRSNSDVDVGDTGRPSSLQPDIVTSTPSQRPFSREGIQQTIENVRKKWFQDSPVPPRNQEGAKITEQISQQPFVPPEQDPVRQETIVEKPKLPSPQQTVSQDKLSDRLSDQSTTVPKESDSDYNMSLDKLNQSLTDLQGEIMKLSLQQEHIKMSATPKKDAIVSDIKEKDHVTVSQTPGVKGKVLSDVPVPTPERVVLGMGSGDPYPTQPIHTQPFIHSQQPVVIQGQQGPILTCQNQFIPVSPATVQYPGYTTGQPPHPSAYHQQNLPQVYTQSPPYSHVIPPQLSPLTSSPFSVTTPYQPFSPVTGTYTVPSSHSHQVVSMAPIGHTGAQMYNPTSVRHSVPNSEISSHISFSQQNDTSVKTQPNVTIPDVRTSSVNEVSEQTLDQNGFFVSFKEGSPKKQKPQLGTMRNSPVHSKLQQKVDSRSPLSHDHSQVSHDQSDTTNVHQQTSSPSILEQTDTQNMSDQDEQSVVQNTSGVGFIIADDQSADDEMYKKKEKLAQLQMKRREEQERKRQYKEIEMARRKERVMLKQEEAERKKADDKARREMIFKQYQEKKRAAEDDTPKRREKPSQQKTRPKSMYAKGKDGMLSDDGSMENLSAHAFTLEHNVNEDVRRERTRDPHKKRCRSCSYSKAGGSRLSSSRLAPPRGKMRKAVSCNTLHDNGKSLMHGGMTHRRPPSPDLYRLKKGKSSTDSSSETGSNNAGSDYAGPKLFVKPSSKSNRHIIINAISHCCLAGCVNTEVKNKVLEEIAKSDGKHFVILFRDGGCQYRSLYQYNPETEDVLKIIGVGPKNITNKMIEKFYKYNSGAKSFSEVTSTKHLSVSIDAVVLHNSVWKSGKPPTAKHMV